MFLLRVLMIVALTATAIPALSSDILATSLTGEIRDAESGQLLPARLYIQSADGAKWFFAKSADPNLVTVATAPSALGLWVARSSARAPDQMALAGIRQSQ